MTSRHELSTIIKCTSNEHIIDSHAERSFRSNHPTNSKSVSKPNEITATAQTRQRRCQNGTASQPTRRGSSDALATDANVWAGGGARGEAGEGESLTCCPRAQFWLYNGGRGSGERTHLLLGRSRYRFNTSVSHSQLWCPPPPPALRDALVERAVMCIGKANMHSM